MLKTEYERKYADILKFNKAFELSGINCNHGEDLIIECDEIMLPWQELNDRDHLFSTVTNKKHFNLISLNRFQNVFCKVLCYFLKKSRRDPILGPSISLVFRPA